MRNIKLDEAFRKSRNPLTKLSKLPIKYKQDKNDGDSFTFLQIDRNEKAAIYKADGEDLWEVFKVKVRKGFTPSMPEKYEDLPKDEYFGKWAWSISDEDEATNKFNEISK